MDSFEDEAETQFIFLCRKVEFREMTLKLDTVHTSFIKC